MNRIFIFISILFLFSCKGKQEEIVHSGLELVVLGNVQDAGSPHAGCEEECCRLLQRNPDPTRMVSCLALLEHNSKEYFLFDATPNMSRQMTLASELINAPSQIPKAIFLTHAHIGHYTGLMFLGKEGMATERVPVYAMPRMKEFLVENGPWNQLIEQRNIKLRTFAEHISYNYNEQIQVKALRVPHRDEYSETVGF